MFCRHRSARPNRDLSYQAEETYTQTWVMGIDIIQTQITDTGDTGDTGRIESRASESYWAFTRYDRRTNRSVRPRLRPTVCQTSRTDRSDRLQPNRPHLSIKSMWPAS